MVGGVDNTPLNNDGGIERNRGNLSSKDHFERTSGLLPREDVHIPSSIGKTPDSSVNNDRLLAKLFSDVGVNIENFSPKDIQKIQIFVREKSLEGMKNLLGAVPKTEGLNAVMRALIDAGNLFDGGGEGKLWIKG